MAEGAESGDYWHRVCAPCLRQRRPDIQETDEQIARFVQERSGKRTSRPQLNLFLSGRREPYISQFIALCTKLGVDPLGILRGVLLVVPETQHRPSTRKFLPLVQTSQQVPIPAVELQSKTGQLAKAKAKKRG